MLCTTKGQCQQWRVVSSLKVARQLPSHRSLQRTNRLRDLSRSDAKTERGGRKRRTASPSSRLRLLFESTRSLPNLLNCSTQSQNKLRCNLIRLFAASAKLILMMMTRCELFKIIAKLFKEITSTFIVPHLSACARLIRMM